MTWMNPAVYKSLSWEGKVARRLFGCGFHGQQQQHTHQKHWMFMYCVMGTYHEDLMSS